MNKILYWSPFTSKVATVKSVINSVEAVNKYLNDNETNRVSKKIKLKKRLKGFTIYHHSLVLRKILI